METRKNKLPKGVFEKVPGSGLYWVRYADAHGKIRREPSGRSLSQAVKLYQKRKTEVLQGKKLPESLRVRRVTFGELAKDCLAYSKVHKRSSGHDQCRMAFLVAQFGDQTASALSHTELNQFLQDLGEEHEWASATYNRYRALLSLTFRLGIEAGKVTNNPARLLKHRMEPSGRVRWLTAEEEAALRAVVDANAEWLAHLPEFVIALNTGMRLSEQCELHWPQVDLERRVIWIPRSKHGGGRHVRLNEESVTAFNQVLTHTGCGKNGRVFAHMTETEALRHEWFNKAIAAAGISAFRWHDLRHTFASRLVMGGEHLLEVQRLMGHKSIQMTCRYAHLAPNAGQEAVERMGSSWSAKVREASSKIEEQIASGNEMAESNTLQVSTNGSYTAGWVN